MYIFTGARGNRRKHFVDEIVILIPQLVIGKWRFRTRHYSSTSSRCEAPDAGAARIGYLRIFAGWEFEELASTIRLI
jgi:hypothetical protein